MKKMKMGGVYDPKPTSKAVFFAGKAINMSAIGRATGHPVGSISRIFNGVRGLSILNARKIAAAMGMGLEDFLEELDKRVAFVKKRDRMMEEQHIARITAEDQADLSTIRNGGIPKPRLPGMRAI